MAKKVIVNPLINVNGDANKEWAKEMSQVLGNKRIKLTLEIEFEDGKNVYGPIGKNTSNLLVGNFSITKQIDELGNDLNNKEFLDANPDTKRFEVDVIGNKDYYFIKFIGSSTDVITHFSFNDVFTIKRNSGTAGDKSNVGQFAMTYLQIDPTTGDEMANQIPMEVIDPFTDRFDINVDESIAKRKTYEIDPDEPLFIDDGFARGYKLVDLGTTEMQLKKLVANIDIRWYDPLSDGGN